MANLGRIPVIGGHDAHFSDRCKRHQAVPPSLALGGMRILSGVVECVFKGAATGEITRDTLTFNVGRVNLGTGVGPTASCTVSPCSFAYDGAVNDAL